MVTKGGSGEPNRLHTHRMLIRRTAKIMAMSRAILATVFLLAVWLQPGLPRDAVAPGFGVLSAYLGWSCLAAALVWRSWWWDFRLAGLMHTLDIMVFLIAVFLTESSHGDFSSPFLAFTAFLLVAATVRWGQGRVVATALVLMLCYAVVSTTALFAGLGIDPYHVGRRLTYMTALSLMMIWLSAGERVTRLAPLPDPGGIPGNRRQPLLTGALVFARDTFHARGAAIAVSRPEEPWVDLHRIVGDDMRYDRIGPGALTEDFAPDTLATLFDLPRGRRITIGPDHRLAPVRGAFAYALADTCGVTKGLLAGFASAGSHGQVLIWGIPEACIDDLPVAAALAREIALALDHEEMAVLAQSLAVTGVRNALARDLHDSVAQFLAGTMFRLEALRRRIREGHDADAEILDIKDALRHEQGQLRTMIDRLRHGIEGDRGTDIVAELDVLMTEMGNHWQIATVLDAGQRPLVVSIGLAHELRQLVREAMANAVRHGGCSRVALTIRRTGERADDTVLRIAIDDDGKGFPGAGAGCRPRSICERIEALGGHVRVANGQAGARLDIELPLGIAA
jgi:signal transduction histidine kinase